MQRKVEMTVEDIEKLVEAIKSLYGNYGRIIIHGDGNGDPTDDIAQNIESETIVSGVMWWAKDYFPELSQKAQSPEHQLFIDDEDWEETYASCGF